MSVPKLTDIIKIEKGYSYVNGIKMYYEIYGKGTPLVLIHGGGSTINTTFGRIIPALSNNRKVIAMELQAHGRTSDRNADLSFEQDADDVVTLLENLNIPKADFFGFSNGGTTALQIAIRHPDVVNKIIVGSALTRRRGVPNEFWNFMKTANLANMPKELQEGYLEVAPDANGLKTMHDRDAQRMVNFEDIPNEKISAITAPVLIINGDRDIITIEHAVEMSRMIKQARLAIIPGVHGEYIGEITTLTKNHNQNNFVTSLIEQFLSEENSSC